MPSIVIPAHNEANGIERCLRALLADNRRLGEATGWTPRVSLEDGLAATIAWWRKRLQRGLQRADARFLS